MSTHEINGHKIDLPDDVNVVLDRGFPGAYDFMVYRGMEINTTDSNPAPTYAGQFVVNVDGDLVTYDTIDQAKAFIDALINSEIEADFIKCDPFDDGLPDFYMEENDDEIGTPLHRL